jgi:Family of unknown function (DUF5677)
MMEFESEWLTELNTELQEQLAFAKELLEFVVALPSTPPAKEHEVPVHRLAFSQYAKITKLFRCVVELCTIGQPDGATIVLRTQIESLLKLQFLLQEHLSFDSHSVSREERGKWIVAQCYFSMENWVTTLGECLAPCEVVTRKQKELENYYRGIQPIIDGIDHSRLERIRKSSRNKFCCLSVRKLAEMVDLGHVYALYPLFSYASHANDFDCHSYVDDQGQFRLKWKASRNDVAEVLLMSCRLMIAATAALNEVFDLDAHDRLNRLVHRLQNLERVFGLGGENQEL